MGWEALTQWGGDAERVEPFTRGVANEVWRVRVNGQLLPSNAADLEDSEHDIAAQASAAWEAAVCWDDDYARTRLAEVRAVRAV